MKYSAKQLKKGAAVEREHRDIYRHLLTGRLTETQFYTMIAKAHLREIPDYYDRLAVMEHHYLKGH